MVIKTIPDFLKYIRSCKAVIDDNILELWFNKDKNIIDCYDFVQNVIDHVKYNKGVDWEKLNNIKIDYYEMEMIVIRYLRSRKIVQEFVLYEAFPKVKVKITNSNIIVGRTKWAKDLSKLASYTLGLLAKELKCYDPNMDRNMLIHVIGSVIS